MFNIQYMDRFLKRVSLLLTQMGREEGQDLAEYALLLVFIAIAVIAALTALGPQLAAIYTQITEALTI